MLCVVFGVGEFGTEVADEGTEGKVLVVVDGRLPIEADVGGKALGGLCGDIAVTVGDGLAVGEVGMDVAATGTEREILIEFHGIGDIGGKLVGVHGAAALALGVGSLDFAQGEVGEG